MQIVPYRFRLAVVTATLLAFALTSMAGAATKGSEREAKASAVLADLADQGFVGSVLVARGGEVLFSGDFGFDPQPRAVPSFWIASITKQFVAAGILILEQRGQLNLDDPISEHLLDVPADKSEITLFHLLTHTSGLEQMYAADGLTDETGARNALLGSPLVAEPGEQFSYANDNYNLLALVLDRRTNQSYEGFLRHEIFEPTGMRHSASWGEPIEQGSVVPPVEVPFQDDTTEPNWGFRGATGMRASVGDLFAWVQSLDGDWPLSKNSVDLLMGNHVQTAGGTEIGFNWFGGQTESGVRMLFSRGQESYGGNAVIYLYPEQDLTIITATNAGPAETGEGPVEGWSRLSHKALAAIYLD
jgi:CubicO group peptidase (beta-lactamase class C family)